MSDLTIFQEVGSYRVTCVPEDHPEQWRMVLRVERTAPIFWAVRWDGQVLNVETREWEHEPMNSGRTQEWLSTHRAHLDEAIQIAREMAPTLTINGHTVQDFLDWQHE